MPEATRIRGRLRGLETVWTPERFGEVIRKEVRGRLAHSWPQERIAAWVREAYDIDVRSVPQMQRVVDALLATLQSGKSMHAGASGQRPCEARRTPGSR